jgi:hypothetical protein
MAETGRKGPLGNAFTGWRKAALADLGVVEATH